MNDDEKLLHMYQGQLAELSFRRSRENEIFNWSSTILIAFIGVALLFTDETRAVLLREWFGACIAAAVMILVTRFSIKWQMKQRDYLAKTQQILVNIERALGFYEHPKVAYPEEWMDWGKKDVELSERLFNKPTKITATAALGVVATIAAFASPILAAIRNCF